MPAPKPISREYRIYLALWRKAYLSEEEVVINASTFSMAVAMRQGMYRAIRPFRNGQSIDEELRHSAEKFVPFIVQGPAKEAPATIIFKHRKALAELDGMFDQLGIDEEDLLLGDERKLNTDLAEFIEKPAEPRKTSFYTRDE